MDDENIMINGKKVVQRQMWKQQGSEMSNGIRMDMHYTYGCNQQIGIGNCYMCEEEVLLYICGRHIVKYEVASKKQTFIIRMTDEQEAVSMASSFNVKTVLSVAIALASSPQLKQYALVRVYRSNRKLPYSCVHSHLPIGVQLKQVQFIQNSKYLITLTQMGTQSYVSIFKTKKEQMIVSSELNEPITMMFGQYYFHRNFGLMGPKYLCSWEFNEDEKTFEQQELIFELQAEEEFIYASALQKNEFFAALTSNGDILVFKKKQMVFRIKVQLPQSDVEDALNQYSNMGESKINKNKKLNSQDYKQNYFPTIMSAHTSGLVVGFQGLNLMAIYDVMKDGKPIFKKTHKFNVPNFHSIVYMHVGPEDGYITMAIQHQQKQINNLFDRATTINQSKSIVSVDNKSDQNQQRYFEQTNAINNIEIYLFNFGIVEVINTALRDPFEYLFQNGVHRGRILDIELSPTKSLILSLSEDKIVKVWEYGYVRADFKCIYSITMHESPMSAALHPMAFQCAIGFREGLKFYFVLENDIKQVYHENIRLCTALNYSHGGDQLAVATQNQINVYSPYHYQLLYVLTGHTGSILSINWFDQDRMISSSCTQGLVFCFSVQTAQRTFEHSFKAHKSICSQYDSDYDFLIGSFVDQKIRVFNEKGGNVFYEMDVYPSTFTCIYICSLMQVVFFGTSNGTVRAYLWPFTNFQVKQQEYSEIALHQSAVSQIRLTPDLNFLISGSEDGSIFITRIQQIIFGKEREVKDILSEDEERVLFSLGNLYQLNQLVNVSSINQDYKKDQIKELQFRIVNLRSDIDDEKERIVNLYNAKIKDLQDSNRQSIANQKETLSATMEEYDNRFKILDKQLNNTRQNHKKVLHDLDDKTSQSLLKQYTKSDKLKLVLNNQLQSDITELEQVRSEYRLLLSEAEGDFNRKFSELSNRQQKAFDNMKLDEKKFKEVFTQSEAEFEILLNQTKSKLLEELEEYNIKSELLRSSNTKQSKECERFTQRKIELEGLNKETTTQIEHLEIERRKFDGKNAEMSAQLNEKEEQINKKEQEIKMLRNKNHHLQNFRTVYDFRLNSLLDEKDPLSSHLGQLDGNTKTIFKELIDESEANKNIDDNMAEIGQKILAMKQVYKSKKENLQESQSSLIALEYSILQTLKESEIQYFPQMFKQVHKDHFLEQKQANMFSTIGNLKVSHQENDQVLKDMERNANEAIKQELMRQRDFLSKKIVTVGRLNNQNEEDRNDVIGRVQNENTSLIRECNTLREERRNLKEHDSNIQKAHRIINKELKMLHQRLGDTANEEGDTNVYAQIKKPQNQLQNQPNKSIQTQKSLSGFQRYHIEKELKRTQVSQSMPKFKQPLPSTNQPQENKELLVNLLREIQVYNTNSGEGIIISKLRDQVHSFIRSEESQVTLPILIQRQVQNQSQSQEETQTMFGELSGVNNNTSIIESKNSFILKKSKQFLPSIRQKN